MLTPSSGQAARLAPIAVLAGFIVMIGMYATTGNARILATCTPQTWIPVPVSHQSKGGGHTACDAGAPNWAYDVRLVNRAGTALAETLHTAQDQSGSGDRWTPLVTCTGAYIHNYYYINVGGTGKSDTSGEYGSPTPC